jgi:hypothetical protein
MDYAQKFSPVGFSDAESIMAISDAQEVDFGFVANPRRIVPGRIAGQDNGASILEKNAVSETRVSDFGVVNYPFGATGRRKKERAVLVAGRVAKGVPPGYRTSVVAGGGTVGSASRPSDALVKVRGEGIESQNETARRVIYFGQLGN